MSARPAVTTDSAAVPTPRLSRRMEAWSSLWDLPELAGSVSVVFSRRLTSTLARCRPAEGRIVLGADLRNAPASRLDEVLFHELAHVAVHRLGPTWCGGRTRGAPRATIPECVVGMDVPAALGASRLMLDLVAHEIRFYRPPRGRREPVAVPEIGTLNARAGLGADCIAMVRRQGQIHAGPRVPPPRGASPQSRQKPADQEKAPRMGYRRALLDHLAEYKSAVLGIHEDGVWRRNGKTYPHILPDVAGEAKPLRCDMPAVP